jgi:fatty-acyl-CoA synthase
MVNAAYLPTTVPFRDSFSQMKRDLDFLRMAIRMHRLIGDVTQDSKQLVADDFEDSVDKHAANIAFRFEGDLTTYAEFDEQANRIAHWALAHGLKAGDRVALCMENCPEYVSIWVGLAKVGVVTALVNTHLEGDPLRHCLSISEAAHIIAGPGRDRSVCKVAAEMEPAPKVWTMGGEHGEDLAAMLPNLSAERPSRDLRAHLRGNDLGLLIYTSGTTGLPKATRVTNSRLQIMMRTFIAPCYTGPRDRVYLTLPLYHATGGVCGIGQAMMTGASIVLRRKFSASAFWDDVVDQGVTSIIYIGELCRYLLNQPPHPKETMHHLKTGFGNGLRPEIWNEFRERFSIPHLVEFYAATDGNVNLMSIDGTTGAVGRIPKWLKARFDHVEFVKYDVEIEDVVRGEDGFVVRAGVNEAGEVLGRIADTEFEFAGYQDPNATEKKILRDVFEPGDKWFRTGDLMRKDENGYVYFVDRIGDTFRWKGENVSTSEVSDAMIRSKGIETANVYGVEIPGTDGRAGMAAITLNAEVDFESLHYELSANLPSYAIPIFIRIQREADTTGTMKYRKVELMKDGYNPDKVDDPIWMYHPDRRQYMPFTQDRYDSLISGAFRF